MLGESYFRNYASERAGKRGVPSEAYARSHPYPTYNQFGDPQFIDVQLRGYKVGDGQDAKNFYKHNTSDPRWNPSEEKDSKSVPPSPGEHLLYMRIKKGALRRNILGFPKSDDALTLIHLKSKRVYQCEVQKVKGHDSGRSNTGTVVIDFIHYKGTVNNEYMQGIKDQLPQSMKPLIKL